MVSTQQLFICFIAKMSIVLTEKKKIRYKQLSTGNKINFKTQQKQNYMQIEEKEKTEIILTWYEFSSC